MNPDPASSRPPASPSGPPAARISRDHRWDWHRRRLLAARQRLLQLRNDHRLEASALGEPAVEGAGEQAVEATEREFLMAELRAEEIQLAEIDAALERLRIGRYGICERTGQPISWERLRALPWTRFSVDAAEPAPGGGRPGQLGPGVVRDRRR